MSRSLSPEQEAQAQQLLPLLRQVAEEDLLHIARLLAATDEAHTFGQTEFDLRDLVLHLGAKALEVSLAQKKTATAARASSAPTASSRPRSRATASRRP
jgi:hypothetical protein